MIPLIFWNLVLFQFGMKMASVTGEGWWLQRCIVLFLSSAALQLKVPSLEVVCVTGDWCINIYEFKHRTSFLRLCPYYWIKHHWEALLAAVVQSPVAPRCGIASGVVLDQTSLLQWFLGRLWELACVTHGSQWVACVSLGGKRIARCVCLCSYLTPPRAAVQPLELEWGWVWPITDF